MLISHSFLFYSRPPPLIQRREPCNPASLDPFKHRPTHLLTRATPLLPQQLAGKVRILDSVREVVALHKDQYVFPVQLGVTKVGVQKWCACEPLAIN